MFSESLGFLIVMVFLGLVILFAVLHRMGLLG